MKITGHGVHLLGNASKRHSGTRSELAERASKMLDASQAILLRHQAVGHARRRGGERVFAQMTAATIVC